MITYRVDGEKVRLIGLDTPKAAPMPEKARWALYMFRQFGAWPGEGPEDVTRREWQPVGNPSLTLPVPQGFPLVMNGAGTDVGVLADELPCMEG